MKKEKESKFSLSVPKKSAPKKPWHMWFLIAVVLFAVGIKLYSFYWPKSTLIVNGQHLNVLVADSYKHLYKGLSGRKSLGQYDGMVFIFPSRDQHTMVMRDMKFPIDIIWIDKGVVVDIAPNVQPESEKLESEYIRYTARAASTMVWEAPAGWAMNHGLKIGDKVVLEK